MRAKIRASQPLNLYRLKDINVTATTSKNIPAKDTHIFIIALIGSLPPLGSLKLT